MSKPIGTRLKAAATYATAAADYYAARARAALGSLRGLDPWEVAAAESNRTLARSDRHFEIDAASIATPGQLAGIRAKRAVGGKLASWQTTIPHYSPSSTRTFIRKGYRGNVPVRACIDMLSRTFSQGRLCIVDSDDKEQKEHDLPGLIMTPTNVRGASDRWTRTIHDLYLSGNAFWEKVRGVGTGRVVELWRLDPQRIAIEPDPVTYIKRYLYQVGGTWHPIPAENVVHWQFPAGGGTEHDPGYFGLPPIATAMPVVDTDLELIDTLKVTSQNRAIPAVWIETEDPDLEEGGGQEARRAWRKKYGGKNRGDVAVMPKGIKVHVIGMNWKEMAVSEVIAVPESRIAMIHGIPRILLGMGDGGGLPGSGGSRIREAKEHFWTDTVLPLQTGIAEIITIYLLPEFGPVAGLQAVFDTSKVPVLQEARLRRAEKARTLFRDGLASRHVSQTMGGIQNHGPDVFYRSSAIEAVFPADATEEDVTEEE